MMEHKAGINADQRCPRGVEMAVQFEAQEASIIVVQQALLATGPFKGPVDRRPGSALPPISDLAELQPALLHAETLGVEDIVNIDECLTRWANDEEC